MQKVKEAKVKNEEVKKEISQQKVKIYTYDEAVKGAKEYFNGDELAANVWVNKYALKDSAGNIYENSPDLMHRRLAKEIVRVEKKYENPYSEEDIYNLIKDFKYIIPQGGPMTGIGNDYQIASLSNCFVVGISGESDSYGGVMKIDEEQVQLMKRRGGVGHDLSHIRPKGSSVMNSALTSTGVTPFMERYSNSTREVAQDGRRGALMLSLSVEHPDAEDFVIAKSDSTKVTGANVSVKIDDKFMKAVKENKEYVQNYPVGSSNPKFSRKIKAKDLWNKVIHNAWKSAEPGVLFWDTVINESIPDCYADLGFKTVSTNPCGEIPLCPYDSCRLLALNLYSYVNNPFTSEASFDYKKFEEHAKMAQRIMDDIVDLELEKVDRIIEKIEKDPEIEEVKLNEKQLWQKIRTKAFQGRRTGIGVTAEGDMLAALGIRYGSEKATTFSENIHKKLAVAAFRGSVNMAKERGAFPIYDSVREEKNPMINRIKAEDTQLHEDMLKYGRRNIALLTIAPTGTTSIMSQTSSGIEPVFLVAYKRRRKVNPNDKKVKIDFVDEIGDSWEEYNVFHHKFETWLKVNGYDLAKVRAMKSKDLDKIIIKSPYHKATANDIDWLNKVKLQGAVQKWIDHSISVTVNIPNKATEELVSQIYMTGWESGCKGMTVYRDGSRSGVLVSSSEKKEDVGTKPFGETKAPKRPKKVEAQIVKFNNDNRKWVAVIGTINNKPYEIFTGALEDSFIIFSQVDKGWVIKNNSSDGKTRYDFQYKDNQGFYTTIEGLSRTFNKEFWNYAKLISGILRHGMPIQFVVEIIEDLHLDNKSLNSWKNGVSRALKKFIPDGTLPTNNICSECNEPTLVYEEGCLNCKTCGDSKCS